MLEVLIVVFSVVDVLLIRFHSLRLALFPAGRSELYQFSILMYESLR